MAKDWDRIKKKVEEHNRRLQEMKEIRKDLSKQVDLGLTNADDMLSRVDLDYDEIRLHNEPEPVREGIREFLDEYEALCLRHGYAIGAPVELGVFRTDPESIKRELDYLRRSEGIDESDEAEPGGQ